MELLKPVKINDTIHAKSLFGQKDGKTKQGGSFFVLEINKRENVER
jgi:hypothetical protein